MTVLIVLLIATASPAQPDTLTLDWAYRAAHNHYPRLEEADLQQRLGRLRQDAQYRSGLLPTVRLTGQAIYHSDVADLPISLPGVSVPGVPHDQYRAGVSIEQIILGGATVVKRSGLEAAGGAVRGQEAEVEAYRVREAVEAVFFGVLLADAQIATLQVFHEDLSARTQQALAAVRRGVATMSSADVLKAELIRVEQQQLTASSSRRAALDVLGVLTGSTLADDANLVLPSVERPLESPRPEYLLFDATRAMLDQQSEVLQLSRRPVAQAFGEAAVGRPPGLNLFEEDFQPFFSVGVRMSWNWDWRATAREREAIDIQKQIVTAQEEAFEQATLSGGARLLREMEQYRGLLEKDAEIIRLRARVAEEMASRLEEGTATATDYLIERNAEFRARLAQRQHRIQLAQALARYNTTVGHPDRARRGRLQEDQR